MALTYTLRSTTTDDTTGGVELITSSSFTPSNSSLLVAIATGLLVDGRSGAPTISNTGTGVGTWTNHLDYWQTNGWASAVAVWTAPVTTGSATTVTATFPDSGVSAASTGARGLVVIEFTGHHATTPAKQVFSDGGTGGRSGAYSGALGAAPASTSYVITATAQDSGNTAGNLTPGTGWTQIYEPISGDNISNFQYRTGSTSTSVAMNAFTTGSWSWVIGGVEIQVAGSTAYTLSAAAGSYLVTGTAATFDRTVVAAAGSYTLTGSAATPTLTAAKTIIAATGGYLLTGTDATPVSITGLAQVGATLQFSVLSNSDSGTIPSAFTDPPGTSFEVPADATFVVVGHSGYSGSARAFPPLLFTKGGVQTAMTRATGGDLENLWASVIHTMALPDTGAGKTLTWDYGFSPSEGRNIYSITFWKGVHLASPVRNSKGHQAVGFPVVTPTLTAQSGDVIVAFAGGFSSTSNGTFTTFSNLTELIELTHLDWNCAAWATGSPSGNTTVAISTVSNISEAGLAAIVLRPTIVSGFSIIAAPSSYSVAGAADITTILARKLDATAAAAYTVTGFEATPSQSGVGGSLPVFRAVSNTTYASRSSTTVDKPTGTVDGDIMVASFFGGAVGGLGDIIVTAPAGWTQLGVTQGVSSADNTTHGKMLVLWKRASSEAANYTFTHGAISSQAVIASYSGSVASGNPIEAFSQNYATGTTTGTATATAITLNPNNKLIYASHNWDNSGTLTVPTGMTERFDGQLYVADEDRVSPGTSGNRTQTLASSGPWQAFLIALKPAPAAATPYAFPPINPAAFLPFLVR